MFRWTLAYMDDPSPLFATIGSGIEEGRGGGLFKGESELKIRISWRI